MIEHLGRVTEPDAVPKHPQTLECDCCTATTDRLWVWPHYGFCVRVLGFQTVFHAGAWSFCVYCHPLFESRQISILVARVASLSPKSTISIPGLLLPVYEVLAQCVYGECRTWEAGQPYTRIWPEGNEVEV